MTHTIFQIIMKWYSMTPKNLNPPSRPNRRDEHGDHIASLHAKDFLAVSAVASSPYRPAILATATHLQLRCTRYKNEDMSFRTEREMRHIHEAIRYIDILDDRQRIVPRIRVLAHTYQVLAETCARFFNLHPRWRRQAAQLRDEAENVFNAAESSSESDTDMDEL